MSLSLRLVRGAMRLAVKPFFRHVARPGRARLAMVFASLLLPLPFGVRARREGASPELVRFAPSAGGDTGLVLLWFHGGAYATGSAFTHRGMLGHIARAGGVVVVAPEYRLAPEHPAPAAFEDAMAALEALRVPVGRVVLGGDSAGGGLAAALCAALLRQGRRPAGLVLLSPWTDLTLSGPSLRDNAARDPMLPAEALPHAVGQIRGTLDAADPRLSPLFAEWRDPPPCLIEVGSTEILLDDALRLAERLREGGGAVTLNRLPGAPHVLAYLAPFVPEANGAIARIGAFMAQLSPPGSSGS